MAFLSGLFGGKEKQGPPPIPKNSVTMMAPQAAVSELALAAFGNVTAYLKKKGCEQFTIAKVEIVAADPDLTMDGLGRIHKGAVSERWHIQAKGKTFVLKMAFGPDGSGGHLVGIAE